MMQQQRQDAISALLDHLEKAIRLGREGDRVETRCDILRLAAESYIAGRDTEALAWKATSQR